MAPQLSDPHTRRAAAKADILAVLAVTGRPIPADADLELAAGSIATFPEAWPFDRTCPWPARGVLIDYRDGLAEIAAQQVAA